jgi:hypothetical protein
MIMMLDAQCIMFNASYCFARTRSWCLVRRGLGVTTRGRDVRGIAVAWLG